MSFFNILNIDGQLLLPLQIIIPLFFGVFVSLIKKHRISYIFSLIILIVNFLISILIAKEISITKQLNYNFGNFLPPYGINYTVDSLTSIILLLVSFFGLISFIWGYYSLKLELKNKTHLFNSLFLVCVSGYQGIAITGDAFNLFVFLEIASLSSYILISMGPDKRCLTSAFNYLIIGTLGACFYVLGIGFIYMITGTLNIEDISSRIKDLQNYNLLYIAIGFITTGLLLKIAIFPLHSWLPRIYTFSPSVATVFFSSISSKVSIYIFLKIIVKTLGSTVGETVYTILNILISLSIINILIGSIKAIKNKDLRNVLAYSSIAQIGYIILAIGIFSEYSIKSAIIFIINHAIIKGGLFIVLGTILYRYNTTHTKNLSGLMKDSPLLFIGLIVGFASLIGIPGTAGFISKFTLLISIFKESLWFVGIIIVITSILPLFYTYKALSNMVINSTTNITCQPINKIPIIMQLTIILIILMNIYLGFNTDLVNNFASKATQTIFNLKS